MTAPFLYQRSNIIKISFLDFTPLEVSVSSPFLKTTSVGILIMLNWDASSLSSSTLTEQTLISSLYSSPISSIIGDSILHGPHQAAQKSLRTGLFDLKPHSQNYFC